MGSGGFGHYMVLDLIIHLGTHIPSTIHNSICALVTFMSRLLRRGNSHVLVEVKHASKAAYPEFPHQTRNWRKIRRISHRRPVQRQCDSLPQLHRGIYQRGRRGAVSAPSSDCAQSQSPVWHPARRYSQGSCTAAPAGHAIRWGSQRPSGQPRSMRRSGKWRLSAPRGDANERSVMRLCTVLWQMS